jgi:hypothetical protein
MSGKRKKVHSIPRFARIIAQPKPSLVHEGGRSQGMTGSLGPHLPFGDSMKLGVDQRDQFALGRGIAFRTSPK